MSFAEAFASPFRRERLRSLDVVLVRSDLMLTAAADDDDDHVAQIRRAEADVLRMAPRTCRCNVVTTSSMHDSVGRVPSVISPGL
jgi:hypothetical protein